MRVVICYLIALFGLLLASLTPPAETICTPDPGYICTSCTQDYYFSSSSTSVCVGVCPTEYTQDPSTYTCSDPSPYPYSIFDTDFSTVTPWSSDTIGDFSTPVANFQTSGGPVLTRDRGIYIAPETYVFLTNSPTPSPSFIIYMWIRPMSSGIIFKVEGNDDYLIISTSTSPCSSPYSISLKVCSDPSTCALVTPYLSSGGRRLATGFGDWQYLIFEIDQTPYSYFIFWMHLNRVAYSGSISGINTIGIVTETFVWTIGDVSVGFEGFVYHMKMYYPDDYVDDLAQVMPPNCDPEYYFQAGLCSSCASLGCTISPLWCVRGTDCSPCYSSQCSSCTGFDSTLCTSNLVCAAHCVQCTDSVACQYCSQGYFLVYDSALGSQCYDNFQVNLMSNVIPPSLTSGGIPSTYFQNNPDGDDPIGYPCRGFYFNGMAFFQSLTAVVLPYNFIVSLWLMPGNGVVFSKGPNLYLDSTMMITVILQNGYGNTYTITVSLAESSVWTYFAFQLTYSYGFQTTVTATDNTGVTASETGPTDYYFRDDDTSAFIIGVDSFSNYFTGFVPYLGIFSLDITSSYNINDQLSMNFYCGTGTQLNICSVYPSSSSSCSETCTVCDTCFDYSASDCYWCESGSYMYGNTCGECAAGLVPYSLSCYAPLGDCFLSAVGLACISCTSTYYLYNNICISQCPSNMLVDSTNLVCDSGSTTEIFVLQFNGFIESASANGFDYGSDSASEYPTLDLNDPIPSLGRGYYFATSSYITSTSYFFGPDLYIAVWVKLDAASGTNDIISKQNGGNDILLLSIGYSRGQAATFSLMTQFGAPYSPEEDSAIDMTIWQYLACSLSFDRATLVTTISVVYNTVSSTSSSAPFDFWSDLPSSLLVIGSNKGTGLTGFLYSVEVYSTSSPSSPLYSTSCATGSQCPSYAVSLDLCAFLQQDSTCLACMGTCTSGCVRTTDCNLCADLLCNYCTSFTAVCTNCPSNSQLVGTDCQCDLRYFEYASSACLACDSTCYTCTDATPTGCTSCSSGVLFSGIDLCQNALACPTLPGIGASALHPSNSCSLSSLMVFYAELDSLEDSFNDQITDILITTGADSSFYPNYGVTDPWVAYGRGYYFTSSTYISIDPGINSKLVLGPEFTLGIWAYVTTPGNIFTRSDTSLICALTTDILGYSTTLNTMGTLVNSASSSFTSSVWHLFDIRVQAVPYGSSVYTAIDNLVQNSLLSLDYFQDSITNVQTLVGDSTGLGFTGFVWSISIYNYYTSFTVPTSAGVAYPSQLSSPLSTCQILEQPPSCTPCMATCLYGCDQASSCSLCLDPLCVTCSGFNYCSTCEQYAIAVSGICQCISFFNTTLNACNPVISCYRNCKSCFDVTAAACTQCIEGYFMVQGYCMRCPTGYSIHNSTCEVESGVAFAMTLGHLDGISYDTYNGIPMITGSSANFYPNYDYDDPIATYKQGYYFNGYSSILHLPVFSSYTGPELVLGPSWTIDIWLMPLSASGLLLSSTSLNGTLFLFYYNGTNFFATLNLTESAPNEISYPFSVSLKNWQLITISLSFGEPNHLYVYLNGAIWGYTLLQGTVFPNYCNITTYSIAANATSFYHGFIYEITVHTYAISPVRFLREAECTAPYQGQCLPVCSVNQYWEGPAITDCTDCQEQCSSCRRGDTCNLCEDPFCVLCGNATLNTCDQCVENAVVEGECTCVNPTIPDYWNFTCEECGVNQYYNTARCLDCPSTCLACQSNMCYSCIGNANLVNGWCQCNLGYNGTNCDLAFFTVSLKVNKDNSMFLAFSDELVVELTVNDLLLTSNTTSVTNFTVLELTGSSYHLTATMADTIPSDCQINITFLNIQKLVSVYNSLLNTSFVTAMLYSSATVTPNITVINSAASTSATTTLVMTSVTIGTVAVNPNPSCLWSFISTIQMLCFIAMSSVVLPPRFKGYLIGLRKFNFFPNIFSYFVPRYGGQRPFEKAYEFGYVDDLILFNSGNYISAFLSMVSIWLVFFILSKFTHKKPFSISFIKKKIESSLEGYKYGAFVRFWITCYIDVFAATLLVFFTTTIFAWNSILNYIFGIIILVLFT